MESGGRRGYSINIPNVGDFADPRVVGETHQGGSR